MHIQPLLHGDRAVALGPIGLYIVEQPQRRSCVEEMCEGEREAGEVPRSGSAGGETVGAGGDVDQTRNERGSEACDDHPEAAARPVGKPRREQAVGAISVFRLDPTLEEIVFVEGEDEVRGGGDDGHQSEEV